MRRRKKEVVAPGTIRTLLPFVKHQWFPIALAVGATGILAVADLGAALPLAWVLDQLVADDLTLKENVDVGRVALIGGGSVLVLSAIASFTTYESELRMQLAGERIIHELRLAIYAQLQRLSISFHQKQKVGDLVTRVTGDVDAIGEIFAKSLNEFINSSLILLFIFGYFLYVNPFYALLAFSIAPLLTFLSVWFKSRARKASKRMRAKEGEIAARSGEVLGAIREVQAFGSEDFEHRRLAEISEERWKAGIYSSKLEGRYASLLDFTGSISAGLVLGFGAWQLSKGQISVGELTVVVTFAKRVYRPLRNIAREASRVSKALARADRVAEVIAADDMLPDPAGGYAGARASGEVQLDQVRFGYTAERPILNGVSLLVPAGEKVAVIGRSGAGKSTIAALVARFYDPDGGRILIDGRDIRECRLGWLRNQVGMVLQESVLFSGTIAENIGYGIDADREVVVAAATAAGAHDFIESMPDGYDTQLEQRGAGLSGGQRQRIAIARTILRNPAILVLDEPTFGLDAASEAEVMSGLESLMRDRTTIMITHSPALMRTADRVVEMQAGRVVRQGTPKELAAELRSIRRAEADEGVAAGRTAPPPDPALPQLERLLDPGEMTPVLERSLGRDASVEDVRVLWLRYRPRRTVVVHYGVKVDGALHDAVAIAAAQRNLARWVTEPSYRQLAELANGRAPAREALSYEPDLDAMLQWLPLDISMPALAQEPFQLGVRLQAAGVPGMIPSGDRVRLLGYRPRRRAVLQLDGHVVKIYAEEDEYEAAVAGLDASTRLGRLRVARSEARLEDWRLTCETLLPGSPPRDDRESAAEAGAVLSALHAQALEALHPVSPEEMLRSAAVSVDSVTGVAPELETRLQTLLQTLEQTRPDPPGFVPSHGNFHSGQLLESGGALGVVDFDDLCSAPPALDVACYAARLVNGGDDDLMLAAAALDGLVEGYGTRPRGLSWHLAAAILRRTPVPFRRLEPSWATRIERMVDDAEEALHL